MAKKLLGLLAVLAAGFALAVGGCGEDDGNGGGGGGGGGGTTTNEPTTTEDDPYDY
jgi:hypothetical protein